MTLRPLELFRDPAIWRTFKTGETLPSCGHNLSEMIRFALGAAVLAGSLLVSQAGDPLANHTKALQSAKGVQMTLQVQPLGGTPSTVKLSMAKPNMIKIETDSGFVLSNGTNIYSYSKKSNTYTETAFSDADLNTALQNVGGWAWAAFYDANFSKRFKSMSAGATRNLRGKSAQEVNFVLANERDASGTIYVDKLNGIAYGYSIKRDGKETLVFTQDLKVLSDATALSFAFTAPEGATKAESIAASVTYAQVAQIMQNSCMPCHGASRQSGGLSLASYDGVVSSLTPGNAEASKLIKSVKGIGMERMPKNRGPLSPAVIAVLEDWINAGAKRD